MKTTLHDVLRRTAAREPGKPALIEGSSAATYRDIAEQTDRLAAALQGLGVARGDRVVICAGNRVETVIAFWAALAAGAVPAVISHEQSVEKIRYIVADCTAAALVAPAELVDRLAGAGLPPSVLGVVTVDGETAAALPAAVVPFARAVGTPGSARPVPVISEDLAALVYTSGSTGQAKGVMLTHAAMLCALSSLNQYLENTSDDVILCVLPLAFDYGLYQMIMAFSVGGTLILERDMSLPLQAMKDIARHRCTVVPGVPVFFDLLEQFSRFGVPDFSSVRAVTNTGAALLPGHIATIGRLFPGAAIYSMYGVTESKRCTYLPPHLIHDKPGSVGIAIPNTEITIVDDDDKECPPYQVGQLVVRGGTVMRGYWGLPEATARKIREHPTRGGRCLYTGDYGYLDADGFFYFKSRMDEVVKVRGRKLIPADIETVLRGVPGVREAAVVGIPRDGGEHEVAAFVAADPGAVTADELRRACQRELERFQVPTRFEVLAALPRNGNGKIDKPLLARGRTDPARSATEPVGSRS
jgi:amino acid adenylation domain-containing protein